MSKDKFQDEVNQVFGAYRALDLYLGRPSTDSERREYVIPSFIERHWLKMAEKFFGVDTTNMTEEEKEEWICKAKAKNNGDIAAKRLAEERAMHGITLEEGERASREFWKTIPERYRDASLSDFTRGGAICTHIMNGGSCLVLGNSGIGKTRMLWAVGKAMAKNYGVGEVVVKNLPYLIGECRVNPDREPWAVYAEEYYGKRVKVLMIDEFDKIKNSPADYEIINSIINARDANMLQTIVVGNGTLSDAEQILGHANVSRLVGENHRGKLYQLQAKDRRTA